MTRTTPPPPAVFMGGIVEKLGSVRMRYPGQLDRPVWLIEPISGCEELLLTSARIGTSANLLAVDAVPSALFEQSPLVALVLPAMPPDIELVIEFANRGSAPARFLVWLGPLPSIERKSQEITLRGLQRRFGGGS